VVGPCGRRGRYSCVAVGTYDGVKVPRLTRLRGDFGVAITTANTAADLMHHKRLMITRSNSPRADTASEVEHGARTVRPT